MANAEQIKKIQEKYAWFVDKENLGIVERKANGYWGSIAEERRIRKHVTKRGDHLTGVDIVDPPHDHLDEQPEFPEQFHMAIVYKAIADLFKLPKNLNMELAQYYELEYMKLIKRAKKYSKRHHISTGFIRGVDF